jgi:hypothetical protein
MVATMKTKRKVKRCLKKVVKAAKRSRNRTVEITASVSAVIATGNYENYKPMFSVKDIVTVNGNADEVISKRTDELRVLLSSKLAEEYDRMRLETVKRTRPDIRIYEKNGKSYPSVTSILSAIEPINFDPVKLAQYASRGTIVHAQADHFLKTGVWESDVAKLPGLMSDYLIVTQGDLKLKWTDCNFQGFWEKYGKNFVVEKTETEVFNDEHIYAGRLDILCTYEGKRTIADIKTASDYDNAKLDKYFRQLSAYAVCEKAEQMVIIPLNPSNKSGFGNPIVETNVEGYFKAFLANRAEFRKIYQF